MSEELVFAGLVPEMELDPEKVIEVEVSGAGAGGLVSELAQELHPIGELKVVEYHRLAADISQFIYLSGSAASIVQALAVLGGWYWSKRDKGSAISITLRSKRGGTVRLQAKTLAEARRLLRKLEDSLKD